VDFARLLSARLAAQDPKLTGRELAARLGVTPSTVSKWLTGDAVPRLNLMPRLCDVFGLSLSEFFDESAIESAIVEEQCG